MSPTKDCAEHVIEINTSMLFVGHEGTSPTWTNRQFEMVNAAALLADKHSAFATTGPFPCREQSEVRASSGRGPGLAQLFSAREDPPGHSLDAMV
jgi:hypothetical protein